MLIFQLVLEYSLLYSTYTNFAVVLKIKYFVMNKRFLFLFTVFVFIILAVVVDKLAVGDGEKFVMIPSGRNGIHYLFPIKDNNTVVKGMEIPMWDKDDAIGKNILERGNEQILKRFAYTASYNRDTRCPNWVGWVLLSEHTDGEFDRKNIMFTEDMDVPRPRAKHSDIRERVSGYQRGHICPAGDNKWNRTALRESFLMTNICPQDGDLNENDWRDIEIKCREWARELGKIYITSGPVFFNDHVKRIGTSQIRVPDAFFKVVLYLPSDSMKAKCIGFLCYNRPGHKDIKDYVCPVDYIESATGLDFFHSLDDNIEDRIEGEKDLGFWFGKKQDYKKNGSHTMHRVII